MFPLPFRSLLLIAAACGCANPPSTAPTFDRSGVPDRPDSPGASIPVYGLAHTGVGRPCEARPFRGFDFWVGKWEVFDNGGGSGIVGWNDVTSEVEGCAVEEHWTDLQGVRGRSLNTYDTGTGRWSQLWMDATGGPLLLTGSAGRRSMVMEGGGGVDNRLTWTQENEGRVRQVWEISQDGRETWEVVFDGAYRRRTRIEPATEVAVGFCDAPTRPRFHWFDFLIGEWTVRQGGETGPRLGSLSVAKDVSGCLVESKYRGDRGYQGKAFAALDFRTFSWNRTWIDRDGVRLASAGVQVGTGMVMTGVRQLPRGVTQTVRTTWTPVTADLVTEQWDVSLDDGTSWTPAWSFFLTRAH